MHASSPIRRNRYHGVLLISDLTVVFWATAAVPLFAPSTALTPAAQVACSALIAVTWFLQLGVMRTRGRHTAGSGSHEFVRVVGATLSLAGLVGVVIAVFQIDALRSYLVVGMPLGVGALLLTRAMWRFRLLTDRLRTGDGNPVLIAGCDRHASRLTGKLRRGPDYRVAAVWRPSEPAGTTVADDAWALVRLARVNQVSAIAIASCDAVRAEVVRELSWLLEGTGIDLVWAPDPALVAGPRMRRRRMADLPVLGIDDPAFTGFSLAAKRAFDLAGALVLGLLFLPLMTVVAALVLIDSGGPVFYRQHRAGRHGRTFSLWKFRTMVCDADRLRATLIDRNEATGALFKIKHDPRTTRIGRLLRRYSLDELPQLWNVLVGQMSLVGPRPPLPGEVTLYAKTTRRRLLVKPGLTGLWQVSGRADLAWEVGVELDLYYIENWSFGMDLAILWRTMRAVADGTGAY